MTETAKRVIDRLQGEAGYATGGEVYRLVFSGLDVHEMLNEIEQAIDTDKLSAEKLQERCDRYEKALTEMKNAFGGATFIDSKNNMHSVSEYVSEALAAIGGDDD